MLILLVCLLLTPQLAATSAIYDDHELTIRRHRKFIRDGNFDETVTVLARGLGPHATPREQQLAGREVDILHKLFHGPVAAPKHRYFIQQAIKWRTDEKQRDHFLEQAAAYRKAHPHLTPYKRAQLVARLRAAVARHRTLEPQAHAARESHRAASDAVLQELDAILGDNRQTSFGAFTNRHGANIALGLYHTADGVVQMLDENDQADAYSGVTPHEVFDGAHRAPSKIRSGAEIARHGINTVYGLMPFVSWGDYNDASKHSMASKLIAGSHLVARISSILHKWIKGDANDLSGPMAHALSYHNRRFGTLQDAKQLSKASRIFGRMRLANRLLGQGLAPGLLAYRYDTRTNEGNYTSPGLAAANISGFVDSIMDIIWRIYKIRKVAKIKQHGTKMKDELIKTPPTTHEQKQDQYIASMMMDTN